MGYRLSRATFPRKGLAFRYEYKREPARGLAYLSRMEASRDDARPPTKSVKYVRSFELTPAFDDSYFEIPIHWWTDVDTFASPSPTPPAPLAATAAGTAYGPAYRRRLWLAGVILLLVALTATMLAVVFPRERGSK